VEGRAAEEGRRAEEPVVETGSSKAGHRDETRSGDRSGSPGAPPKSRLAPLLLLTLLLAAGVLAASGLGWIRIPIVDRALIPLLGPARAGVAPAVTHPEPVPESPLLGYSLTIDVYRDAASAGEVAQALGQRLPGLHFVIAPVSVDGQALYRLLAGPATTAREAEALRDSLAGVLAREDPRRWVVRATPLAFLLDEAESVTEARRTRERAAASGIPTYILRVRYPGDGERYRVYAGAYESPAEARTLNGMLTLSEVGEATFTERRGYLSR